LQAQSVSKKQEQYAQWHPAAAGTISAGRRSGETCILNGMENFQRISSKTQENPLNNNPTRKNNIKIFSKEQRLSLIGLISVTYS
jgi:hypothetical protein